MFSEGNGSSPPLRREALRLRPPVGPPVQSADTPFGGRRACRFRHGRLSVTPTARRRKRGQQLGFATGRRLLVALATLLVGSLATFLGASGVVVGGFLLLWSGFTGALTGPLALRLTLSFCIGLAIVLPTIDRPMSPPASLVQSRTAPPATGGALGGRPSARRGAGRVARCRECILDHDLPHHGRRRRHAGAAHPGSGRESGASRTRRGQGPCDGATSLSRPGVRRVVCDPGRHGELGVVRRRRPDSNGDEDPIPDEVWSRPRLSGQRTR